jgi:hypothetical protein
MRPVAGRIAPTDRPVIAQNVHTRQMPTIPDGEPRGPEDRRAAGWLPSGGGFATGPVGEPYAHRLFCERLFEASRAWVVDVRRGFHPCALCPSDDRAVMVRVERNGRTAHLGNGEIHATDRSGQGWAAPTLIYHYVTAHGYRPPAGFVDAVTAGTLQPPDPPPPDALRSGDLLGPLAVLDPDLDAEVRAALTDADVVVRAAERFEEPGVWRPVLAFAVTLPGDGGSHLIPFDGTDSWRDRVRGLR